MKRRAARTDGNHAEVVATIVKCGGNVLSLAALGDGVYDLLFGFRGRLGLMEIKDGSKPPSARTLTPLQVEFRKKWAEYPLFEVKSPEEAIQAMQHLSGIHRPHEPNYWCAEEPSSITLDTDSQR